MMRKEGKERRGGGGARCQAAVGSDVVRGRAAGARAGCDSVTPSADRRTQDTTDARAGEREPIGGVALTNGPILI
jgi:hypothetical protein